MRIATAVIIAALYDTADTEYPDLLDPERRFCTSGFITSPTDSVRPSQIFEGRITDVDLGDSEVAAVGFFGRKASNRAGSITVANVRNELRALREKLSVNRRVEVLSGDPDQDFSTWRVDFVGLLEEAPCNGPLCTLMIGSGAAQLDRVALTPQYSSGPLAGQRQPLTIGTCLNVPAVLQDPAGLIYRYADAACMIQRVRAQGDELPGSDFTDNSDGSFELLVAPIGRITCDVIGPASTTDSLNTSSLLGFVHSVLERCQIPVSVVGATVVALNDLEYTYGYHSTSSVTGRQILDELVASIGACYWFDRAGKLQIRQLRGLAATPVAAIDHALHGVKDASYARRADRMPGYSTTIAALRNWHVHSANEVAGSVMVTALGAQLQSDYRYRHDGTAMAVDPSQQMLVDQFEGARVGKVAQVGIGTLLQVAADADAEGNRWAELYAVPREFFEVNALPLPQFSALELMDETELTSPDHLLGVSGFPCLVTAIARTATGIKFELWG